MSKFATGVFTLKNGKKYVGKKPPTYRSSWEYKIFKWMDETPQVISWASEPIKIPYVNPLKPNANGKPNFYIPDLLFTYIDGKTGKQVTEMVEIKPIKETLAEHVKTKRDMMAYTVNQAKWQQATAWCKQHGITFRILTERDIFGVK